MASSRLLTVLSTFLLVSSGAAFNCSAPPVFIDIHSRIVHGTPIFQYGSFIGVGSPGQNQSLVPSLRQNETSFAAVTFCDSSNLADCAQSTHGNFNPRDSSTWIEDSAYRSTDLNSVATKVVSGRDNIHLYTHFFETDPAWEHLVTDTPISIALNGSRNPGVVGLGLSSTLLRSLFDDGVIAARTFGLYIGSGMKRANGLVNGSIVFGGYDSGRFTGPVHSYPINTQYQDPFTVGVTDIIIDNPRGERNVSLYDPRRFPTNKPAAPFTARLSTDEYTISMPSSLTQNFASLLSAVPSDLYDDGSLALSPAANGTTMTFVLSDGYRVTIPSEVMYNVSGISPVAARDANSTAPFTLGQSFLSQVYLAADYDNYIFHLADVVAKNNYVMPVTFCPKTTPKAYIRPSSNVFRKEGMVGAVVGGVFGSIGLVVGLVVLTIVLRRKIRARQAKKAAEQITARSEQKVQAFQQLDIESQSSHSGKDDRWRKI